MVGTGMADRDLPVLEANPQNRDMASKLSAGRPEEPWQANREPFLNAKPGLLDYINTNQYVCLGDLEIIDQEKRDAHMFTDFFGSSIQTLS